MTALRLSRSADAIRPGVFAELQARIEHMLFSTPGHAIEEEEVAHG